MTSGHRMVVEAGKVREFAAATGSTHPAYVSAEAASSPPTFLIAKRFWQDDEDDPWTGAGLDRGRMLHAGEEFTFVGPPPGPGAVLTFRSRIESVYTKPGRRGGELTFAVLLTEFRDESGALRATGRTTVVQPARAPGEPR